MREQAISTRAQRRTAAFLPTDKSGGLLRGLLMGGSTCSKNLPYRLQGAGRLTSQYINSLSFAPWHNTSATQEQLRASICRSLPSHNRSSHSSRYSVCVS